jgi:predicted DNA-binding protein
METQALSFRLPVALYERLRRAAFDMRVPMNTIVTEAIEGHLNELERAAAE